MADEPTNSVDMLYPDEHPRDLSAFAVALARRTNARMQLDDVRPRAPLDETQRKAYECLRGGLNAAWQHNLLTGGDADERERLEALDFDAANKLERK